MKRSRTQAFLPLAISLFILVFPSYLHCSYFAEANLFSTDLGFEDSGYDIKAIIRAFASACGPKLPALMLSEFTRHMGYLLSQFISL